MQIVLDTLIVTTDLLISIIVKNKAEFKKKKHKPLLSIFTLFYRVCRICVSPIEPRHFRI